MAAIVSFLIAVAVLVVSMVISSNNFGYRFGDLQSAAIKGGILILAIHACAILVAPVLGNLTLIGLLILWVAGLKFLFNLDWVKAFVLALINFGLGYVVSLVVRF